MKRFKYFSLFILLGIFNVINLSARDSEDIEKVADANLVRVTILRTPGPHISPVTAYVSSPVSGLISTIGEVGSGDSSSVVGTPNVLIGNNLVMLVFDFKTPLPSTSNSFTLHVTNGLGYDKYITCGTTYHFQDAVPLNPNGDTVIAIYVSD